MPSRTFDVEVRNLDVIKRKLDAGNIFTPVKHLMIEEAAKAGKKTMDEESKGQFGKKGFGRRTHITLEQGGMVGRVAIDKQVSGIAATVDQGRRAGRRPPYKPIKAWAQAAGISTPIRELQEAIKAGGTGGVFFMRDAAQVADDTLRARVAPTERAVEAQWNR